MQPTPVELFDSKSPSANNGVIHDKISVRKTFEHDKYSKNETMRPLHSERQGVIGDSKAISPESLSDLLKKDPKIKIGAVDIDGQVRGKLISKKKFLSGAAHGFGFCSVFFGWDMHDVGYLGDSSIGNSENGFKDLLAVPDLSSFRRIPWENDIPMFLVNFFDPHTRSPVIACPRSLLATVIEESKNRGWNALAGVEYEFFHFKVPRTGEMSKDCAPPSVANFLKEHPADSLPPLTEGVHGYSLTRPVENQDYATALNEACDEFDCGIEGWHTESGPGVFEAALSYDDMARMADKAALFKYTVKCMATKFAITPCFMAKPMASVPGCSGHIHISLTDRNGENLFAREGPDPCARWDDIAYLSDIGRHFLAGLLEGLPDIMPVIAPTINSYKRFVDNVWAPLNVSWGLEHRSAAIRLITPPTAKTTATRFEVRVPGADANPHLVLAAIMAIGLRGVRKNLEITQPPIGRSTEKLNTTSKTPQIPAGAKLPKTLQEANIAFLRPGSIAREVLGDEFVDHFGISRDHEVRLWNDAVTDWEMRRYIETV